MAFWTAAGATPDRVVRRVAVGYLTSSSGRLTLSFIH